MRDKACFSKIGYVDPSGGRLWVDVSLELSPVVKSHPAFPGREKEARESPCICFFSLAFSPE